MKIEEFDKLEKITPKIKYFEFVLNSKKIDGLNLEFGVFKGASINLFANFIKDQIFWGFDSFEGLPEDWKTNHDGNFKHVKGYFKTEVPKVRENVNLVKGWFDQTIPKWKENNKGPISFLHIDSDLYSSCKTILNELNDQIVKGTIISFDELCDWRTDEEIPKGKKRYEKWEEGEFKALNEWLESENRKVKAIARTHKFQACVEVLK